MTTLVQIEQRARKTLDEMRQLRVDIEYWNSVHPQEPFDPEEFAPRKEMLALSRFIADIRARIVSHKLPVTNHDSRRNHE